MIVQLYNELYNGYTIIHRRNNFNAPSGITKYDVYLKGLK